EIFVDVSPRLAVVSVAVAGVAYFLAESWGYAEAGRIAGFSIGVFIGIIAMCRPIWKRRWLWMLLLSIATLHIAIIVSIRWPEIHYPTLMIAPLAIVDFFVIKKMIEVIANYLDATHPPG